MTMYPSSRAISVNPPSSDAQSRILQWGKIFLEQHRRTHSYIPFLQFINFLPGQFYTNLVNKNNKLSLAVSDTLSWHGDEEALSFVFDNLLNNINSRSENGTISINTFEDDDFITMVIRHTGQAVLRTELDAIFNNMPTSDNEINKQQLYFCWHTLKLMGGFLTVPTTPENGNYVTIGLPKEMPHARQVRIAC
jgi:K+-sensing histidine kinase KdpD